LPRIASDASGAVLREEPMAVRPLEQGRRHQLWAPTGQLLIINMTMVAKVML